MAGEQHGRGMETACCVCESALSGFDAQKVGISSVYILKANHVLI